jgi:hypothetical protein
MQWHTIDNYKNGKLYRSNIDHKVFILRLSPTPSRKELKILIIDDKGENSNTIANVVYKFFFYNV